MNTKYRTRILLSLPVLLAMTLPASAQQEKANARSPRTNARVQAQPPASTASPDASRNNISLPIIGKGTANFIPFFTGSYTIGNSILSQSSGALSVSGTVNARSFSGDGSALTNVNASVLDGLSSSAFAQQGGSNTFVGDQTITGNLNVTGFLNNSLILQGNLTDSNGQEGANVIGGFVGVPGSPGNSIAPGVIGATIAGGGGVYDPSLLPPKTTHRLSRSQLDDLRSRLKNRLRPRRVPGMNTVPNSSDAEPSSSDGAVSSGLISGSNVVIENGFWSTIGGGFGNKVGYYFATVAGGEQNYASGLESTVGGGSNNVAGGSNTEGDATVAGGNSNAASGDGATVGGGRNNIASGSGATVAGGDDNTGNVADSVVGGGLQNLATGNSDGYSTVAGGYLNTAYDYAFVGGGFSNTASGIGSSVPGGAYNLAVGDYSFAAGCGAQATFLGSFVWSGTANEGCARYAQDTGPSQFVAEASGGFFLYTSSGSLSSGPTGATLPAGSGSWSSLSDRNSKENFSPVDGTSLLEKLASVQVATWNYKAQADSIRHLGPTAQDFHAAFGLGEDDKHISTVDAEGVALAGIQALYRAISELKQNLADKDHEITELRERLAHLEQAVSSH